MGIPVFDLTRQYQEIGPQLERAVAAVMAKGHFILGEQVAALEQEVAAYCGTAFGIGVANGSDAIHLALLVLGIGPGDEVVVPSFTFFATAGAVALTGATPVFADVDPVTYNLDPDSFARSITHRTKAVIPVHLYGQPADMERIMLVARAHGIRVIEDAAQSIGAEYRGQRVGSLGDLATLSFFPTKNLGAYGDGGMVLTSDPDLAVRIRRLRSHGASRKYFHEELGFNSRLDELQAAILRVKLPYLDRWTGARQALAQAYRERLTGLGMDLPSAAPDGRHVFHQFTIRVPDRAGLVARFDAAGIGYAIYYPTPLHAQPVFAGTGGLASALPVSEGAAREVISLPMFPELTVPEVAAVCGVIRAHVDAARGR